jgi:hypothetical protein
LICTWLYGDFSKRPEWTGRGTKSQTDRIAKDATRSMVAELGRIWERERGGFDCFETRIDTRDFNVGATKRTNDQKVVL